MRNLTPEQITTAATLAVEMMIADEMLSFDGDDKECEINLAKQEIARVVCLLKAVGIVTKGFQGLLPASSPTATAPAAKPAEQPPQAPEPAPEPEPAPQRLSSIVTNVQVNKRADGSGYDLTFNGVEGATGYELAYTSPSLGKWEKLEFQGTSLFVPVGRLPPDQVTYAIIAVNELGRAQDAEGKDLFSPDMTF